MKTNYMMTAEDVAEQLGISKGHAYKIVKQLNQELEKRNTWTCSFYYKDWTGKQKKKLKRGFKTKREATEFEAQFKLTANANMDMKMEAFIDVYFKDKEGELKQRTINNKKYMIKRHANHGTYFVENDEVVATTSDEKYAFVFRIIDDSTITFVEDQSASTKTVEGKTAVLDGAVFNK